MRVMAAAVLSMEFILMGFALLIAKDSATTSQLWLGASLAIACLLCAGMLKRKSGYYLGSFLQICIVLYGLVINSMYYLGGLFLVLWVFAIVLGRRGEAIKARLIAQRDADEAKSP